MGFLPYEADINEGGTAYCCYAEARPADSSDEAAAAGGPDGMIPATQRRDNIKLRFGAVE